MLHTEPAFILPLDREFQLCMMFKKQDEGKFEQISEFSLSKSLASKLEMPCE